MILPSGAENRILFEKEIHLEKLVSWKFFVLILDRYGVTQKNGGTFSPFSSQGGGVIIPCSKHR